MLKKLKKFHFSFLSEFYYPSDCVLYIFLKIYKKYTHINNTAIAENCLVCYTILLQWWYLRVQS